MYLGRSLLKLSSEITFFLLEGIKITAETRSQPFGLPSYEGGVTQAQWDESP